MKIPERYGKNKPRNTSGKRKKPPEKRTTI
ncbi:hypothetical protein BPO_1238 [Bergeyella porcorum]|uniref:Uncharacterized protein n=1 Tax=Bergeyella porcorum TaxID=1735111 RepID=A0AAU0F1C9_9FLAO